MCRLSVCSSLENCDETFSISNIKANVEIWRERHAYVIMDTFAEVFQDLSHNTGQGYDSQDYFDGDDEEDDDWNALFNDTELRWLDWIFLGGYLPMSKDREKRLPQLYYIR